MELILHFIQLTDIRYAFIGTEIYEFDVVCQVLKIL